MRRVLPVVILGLLVLSSSASAQGAKPNFSGKWILDAAKSDFAGMTPLEFMSHEIQHKEPTIKIATTQKTARGSLNNERTLTTDGKANANRMKTTAGDQDVKSTSTWDGAKLTTAMKVDIQGSAATIDDVWELSPDGKVLTITRRTTAAGESITQKFVFNKQ